MPSSSGSFFDPTTAAFVVPFEAVTAGERVDSAEFVESIVVGVVWVVIVRVESAVALAAAVVVSMLEMAGTVMPVEPAKVLVADNNTVANGVEGGGGGSVTVMSPGSSSSSSAAAMASTLASVVGVEVDFFLLKVRSRA